MAGSNTGTGTLDFVGITMKYYSPDGFTAFSFDAGKADSTADDATSKTYNPGDKPDYGNLTGTILIDATDIAELKTILDACTTDTLTLTLPLSVTGGTAGTVIGQAFIETLDLNTAENTRVLAPVSFAWASKPVITAES